MSDENSNLPAGVTQRHEKFNSEEPQTKPCEDCEGTGDCIYSCCGDDMRGRDFDNCPTCKEHTGYEKGGGDCYTCNGAGKIPLSEDETRELIEAQKEPDDL